MTELFESLFRLFPRLHWQDYLDFFIIYYVIYRVLLLIKGTRAVQMLTGFGIIIIVFLLSKILGLYTLYFLLKQILSPLVIIFIVIFQDDIRRALAHVGRNPFLSAGPSIEEIHMVDEIVKACFSLAQKKVGALVVLERETGLGNLIEEGVRLDAKVNSEIMVSMFLPYSPVHDGALVIKDGRMISARCFLPLSKNPSIPKRYGSRHRAALGITEISDAVVLLVSEEHGNVSLVVDGRIRKGIDAPTLSKNLMVLLEGERLS